jgi:hypothetical protein
MRSPFHWFQKPSRAFTSTARFHSQQKSSARRRFRQLLLEQFEDRRLMAGAADDSYSTPANDALVVTAEDGTLLNDDYEPSWNSDDWTCYETTHIVEHWENAVLVQYGYYDPEEPVSHEEYTDFNGVVHDAYIEDPVWYPPVYDYSNATWIPEHDECTSSGYESTTHYASPQIQSQPAHGSLSSDDGGNTFTYTPDFNFVGPDSFTYSIGDENGSSTATVTIDVTSDGGQAPIGNSDTYSAIINTTLTAPVSVLANDTDAEGDTLTASKLIDPLHGTLTAFNPDGHFTYAPDTGFTGWDSLTYQASDGYLAAPTIVWIYVDDPPVAADDSYTVAQDTPFFGGHIMANDWNPGNQFLLPVVISRPTHGTFEYLQDGQFS